ncbi:MAG: hypothetical protein WBZ48_04725 [Bacteroidota bacterium]
MKGKILLNSLAFGIIVVFSNTNCQIPSAGSDLPSLSGVRWGMSMHEVKGRMNRDVNGEDDTAMTFRDSFVDSNVQVTLAFGEADTLKGLRFVEIQFDDKNVEKLRSYLKARYGEKYETEKKEKSKLFFTVNFEAAKWYLKSESIVMIVFSQGDQVLALSLLYKWTGG